MMGKVEIDQSGSKDCKLSMAQHCWGVLRGEKHQLMVSCPGEVA